jgi:hypothetical protein
MEKIKKSAVAVTVFIGFFSLVFSGCASTLPLTPGEITKNIFPLENLELCDFYISKGITLTYNGTERANRYEGGVVITQNVTRNITLKIPSSRNGSLRTESNAGQKMQGYQLTPVDGSIMLRLWINFFPGDKDKEIMFQAIYDNAEDKFQMTSDEVVFGSNLYRISYSGVERPYLNYKLINRDIVENISITAGRQ